MRIDDFMNPNRKDVKTDCVIRSGSRIEELLPEQIQTDGEFIGIQNDDGVRCGAIRSDRLEFIWRKIHDFPFSQILDHLNIGVIAIDRDSKIFYVNPAYARILDVSAGKIIGRYISVIEKHAALLDVLESGKEEHRSMQLIETLDKYVSVNIYPLYQNGELAGAVSFFTDITELNHLNSEVKRITRVAEEYSRQIRAQDYLGEHHIVGESAEYINCVKRAVQAARSDATVLIRGENGTGKEVISNVIQQNSERAKKPFVKVNCAAIPESLMESELFGYEEGSFTGARRGGRYGKFELADGGTLFLDEIGDIPLSMQAKLLRVLQEGEVEKVGAQKPVPVDVRVIAATNQPLEEMIESGSFRRDLYYRLNVVTLEIPPLRHRGNDVILLAGEFLEMFNQKYHCEKQLGSDAYRALVSYAWPGNVRELQNAIESAVVLSEADMITAEDLPVFSRIADLRRSEGKDSVNTFQADGEEQCRTEKSLYADGEEQCQTEKSRYPDGEEAVARPGINWLEFEGISLKEATDLFEQKMIRETLARCKGSRTRAMEILQVPKRTFYRKLADMDMENDQ